MRILEPLTVGRGKSSDLSPNSTRVEPTEGEESMDVDDSVDNESEPSKPSPGKRPRRSKRLRKQPVSIANLLICALAKDKFNSQLPNHSTLTESEKRLSNLQWQQNENQLVEDYWKESEHAQQPPGPRGWV